MQITEHVEVESSTLNLLSGYSIFGVLRGLWTFAVERPAVFGAVCYFYVSATGLLYNVFYFALLDVDILSFYQVGDFFLSGLKKPLVLLVPVTLIATMVAVMFLSLILDRFHNRFRRNVAKSLSSRGTYEWAANLARRYNALVDRLNAYTRRLHRFLPALYGFAGLLYSVLAVFLLAAQDADRVSNWPPAFRDCVYTEDDDAPEINSPGVFIGSTQSVYFFLLGETVHAIPQDRVTRIVRAKASTKSCDSQQHLDEPGAGSSAPTNGSP